MSGEELVPITREFLKAFYGKHPIAPPPDAFVAATSRLDACVAELASAHGSAVVESTRFACPHKIDENFYRNREQCEEVESHLAKLAASPGMSEKARASCEEAGRLVLESTAGIADFQKWNSDRVANIVAQYLPSDFRGTLILQQKERGEVRRAKELADLVAGGCTIREKYQLLWTQQMDRRKMLAQLGSASGVFKAIVKFLAGVPEVLLEFVTKINDENGPMEEQREAYGPSVYACTTSSNNAHILCKIWEAESESLAGRAEELSEVVVTFARAYVLEVRRVREFIATVFEKSPFLITAEEASRAAGGGADTGEFKTDAIAAGKVHEVSLGVEFEGMTVGWEYTVDYEIGFAVEFVGPDGTSMAMLPPTKAKAHEGHFVAPFAGICRMKWDNGASWMTACSLKYRASAVPPLAGAD